MSGISGVPVNISEASAAEAAYLQLGALLAAQPDLSGRSPISDETLQWLGEVSAAASGVGTILDTAELQSACSLFLNTQQQSHALKIKFVLYRLLALAQQKAPATAQGAFVPTGAGFDAFAAFNRIFREAKRTILIVDPYMDETVLTSFAVLIEPTVSLALLTDENGMKPGLGPAARAWINQYGSSRKLSVRKAASRTLHDRLLLADSDKAWILTQSLKDFAARSPATIQRVDKQLASMKFAAYTEIWNASVSIAETPADVQ